jgi:hypothetical protein
VTVPSSPDGLRRVVAVIAEELARWAGTEAAKRHALDSTPERPDSRPWHPDRAQAGRAPPAPVAPDRGRGLTPEEQEQTIGTAMMRLLLDFRWTHRRVELVRFIDAGTVHRQMSVDFTLPTDRRTVGLRRLRPQVAPLAMLKKRNLSRFSLWDEEGRRLPMYTTEQNGAYAAATLVALVRVAAVELAQSDTPVAPDDVVFEAFRRVAVEPTKRATVVLDCLKEGVAAHAVRLKELGESAPDRLRDKDEKMLPVGAWPTRDVVDALAPRSDVTKSLMTRRGLRHMAEQLASQFIVLTDLSGDAGARRVIKFSYEEPPHSYRPSNLPLRRKLIRPVRALLEAFSWWHRTITLDSVPVGTARSYHVEVEAPDDIELIGARLTAEDPGRDDDVPYRARSTTTESQRVHLQVSKAPRAVRGPVWVQVRAVRDGFLRSALMLALVVAALLWFGEDQLTTISAKAEAPAALLLAVPTVLAAVLIRPGEHAMASGLLLGVRALLMGSAGCALVAASVIAAGYRPNTQQDVWDHAKWAAVGLAGALLLSYVLPYATPWVSRAGSWVSEQGARLRRKLKQNSQKSDATPTI